MLRTMMILIDLFPFGLGNGDETGLPAVDGTAGPLDLDVPIVFYMNDYYKAYVSYVITLIMIIIIVLIIIMTRIFWYTIMAMLVIGCLKRELKI